MLTVITTLQNLQEINAGIYVSVTALYAICKIDVRILLFVLYTYPDSITHVYCRVLFPLVTSSLK